LDGRRDSLSTIKVAMIEVTAKHKSDMRFNWNVYDPSTGHYVEIDPHTGEVCMTSMGNFSQEMLSIIVAMSEFCEVDSRDFAKANLKKNLAALQAKVGF